MTSKNFDDDIDTIATSELTESIATLPADIGLDELMSVLIAAEVPVDTYGKGNAKTVLHLLSEVNEGEAVITIGKSNKLHRTVSVMWVDVFCALADGSIYRLREDRQEFKDGRVKRRQLDSSIGEKIKPGESPKEAVTRAISEELGVDAVDDMHAVGYTERSFVPDTFPGLESTYKMHQYAITLPEEAYRPEGFIEYQEDKTNFYVWEPVFLAN